MKSYNNDTKNELNEENSLNSISWLRKGLQTFALTSVVFASQVEDDRCNHTSQALIRLLGEMKVIRNVIR